MLNGKLHPRRHAPLVTGSVALVAAGLLLVGCSTGTTAGNVAAETAAPEPSETALATTPAETAEPRSTTDATEPAETREGTEVPVMINSAFLDTAAGTIEVRGTIAEYIGDGTCTVTAVAADGTELTADAAATPDAQSTICAPITISGVTGSDWQVTLSFAGDGVWGESEPLAAEVG
ncbi:hypothetical protein [Gulosibacter massiliensis]|uniref:hypothetical protein n=1 Tax=Gulosibacter massiliensis TaxID=2479839 RepID=UPI000F62C895|nr:hypothetical protein [Gulosibacter massiliensis]